MGTSSPDPLLSCGPGTHWSTDSRRSPFPGPDTPCCATELLPCCAWAYTTVYFAFEQNNRMVANRQA